MGLVNLSKRTIGQGFEYSETIADDTNGDTILFPKLSESRIVTCNMIAGTNTGKFQYTVSSDAKVAAGTCTWIDWPKGTVTGTHTDALLAPITGLRGVSVSGEVNIEVLY
jgi:hypothetical protein